MQSYISGVNNLANVDFQSLRRVAKSEISHLDELEKDKLWSKLDRGVALLNTHEELCQYLFAFGNMHQAKLIDAFKAMPDSVFQLPFNVIDWGCGQAMGTMNLFDYVDEKIGNNNVRDIILIEPGKAALERAKIHVDKYSDQLLNACVKTICAYFENIKPEDLLFSNTHPILHIFSNILDVEQIDLKYLASLVDRQSEVENFLVCVGPLNPNNGRIDSFLKYFDTEKRQLIHSFEQSSYRGKTWTNKTRIYKLNVDEKGHLIPIEYYPPVQFQISYQIDCVRSVLKELGIDFPNLYTYFETAAPFDLGASVYDDVNPILAVLNNIISRGLPTFASPYIEDVFVSTFSLTEKNIHGGQIIYKKNENFDTSRFSRVLEKLSGQSLDFLDEIDDQYAQLFLTPISIARFQKVLLEAIITGHLVLEKEVWNILVEENDVPFARLALDDFEMLFNNITQLSTSFDHLKWPKINLKIVNKSRFFNSPLHLDTKVSNTDSNWRKEEFDLVVTQSILNEEERNIENFSKYKALNNCYFNILSAKTRKVERSIYTSDAIYYRPLVVKDQSGNYTEIEEQKANLEYFVQLLFRKQGFRAGQLPILDRAIQHKAVIGLLPTGGGKSLTYQLAALLQPGVTIIVDPLKSLMIDQYEGLLNNGIDCIGYLNSTQTKIEKDEVERRLESSLLSMIFISPERLSIASFRERLKHMHDYNVYFAYGVIDEVHCVSEWGHDFRFSYLHLGRNLYNYVLPKSNNISLFGLTATASFDVLADVERELSANGTFYLDSDTIIRFENTNRLELQYKIEKVKIEFEVDKYFDKNQKLDSSLPKALDINSSFAAFDSKGKHLRQLYKEVPGYLDELLQEESILKIKKGFEDRQGNNFGLDEDLNTKLSVDYFESQDKYYQAGIVFCPHVKGTGLSVEYNTNSLLKEGVVDIASFSGKDEDNIAIENLTRFRDNKSPLMIATKAFGMGIDKPNVRFTVNMNFPSSLESFVQEAGRAGRDRKMALSTIIVADYNLSAIRKDCPINTFPIGLLKDKWFHAGELKTILNYYYLDISDEYISHANPANDIAKLKCIKDSKMFAFKECNDTCTEFGRCQLKNASDNVRGWKSERELVDLLNAEGLRISKKNFTYLSPDYGVPMFFYNASFKGDIVEKRFMNEILNTGEVYLDPECNNINKGFLNPLLSTALNQELLIYIRYINTGKEANYIDLCKAIYRLCCIELIEDFTQDYTKSLFRIKVTNKSQGSYYSGLKRFLLRYYTTERSAIELERVKEIDIKNFDNNEIKREIYQCINYLTTFVYDKISEKRKRGLDDMRNFCITGLDENYTWLENNERLKDDLFYYFNSKYAKPDYLADNGEPYSLVVDTEEGRFSSPEILFKFLKVSQENFEGLSTPLDNVRHLYGAVRLIGRSLTDSNPTLFLLEAFCLSYLGFKNNGNLKNQFIDRYTEGLLEFANRFTNQKEFWELNKRYQKIIKRNFEDRLLLKELDDMLQVKIHFNQFKAIAKRYKDNE